MVRIGTTRLNLIDSILVKHNYLDREGDSTRMPRQKYDQMMKEIKQAVRVDTKTLAKAIDFLGRRTPKVPYGKLGCDRTGTCDFLTMMFKFLSCPHMPIPKSNPRQVCCENTRLQKAQASHM